MRSDWRTTTETSHSLRWNRCKLNLVSCATGNGLLKLNWKLFIAIYFWHVNLIQAQLSTNLSLKHFRFFTGFAFTALLSMFNSIFDGRVVARLPFTPISWIQGLSHRNLSGTDYTECSFIFLYILCTMSIRQNVQKLLGFSPSRAASKQGIFGAPPGQ